MQKYRIMKNSYGSFSLEKKLKAGSEQDLALAEKFVTKIYVLNSVAET